MKKQVQQVMKVHIKNQVDYSPFEFYRKRIPIIALICSEPQFLKQKKPNQNFTIISNYCQTIRLKSTPRSMRELLTDTYEITLTERILPNKTLNITSIKKCS